MTSENPAVHVCKDPRPSSAEGRLTQAIEAVELALSCLDLGRLRWSPVAADAWERAANGLTQVREELTAALTAWRGSRKAASDAEPESV
jgi:hypothetical protein